MRPSSSAAPRVGFAGTRQFMTAVASVTVLSACSGPASTPTRATDVPSLVALSISGSGSGSGRIISSPVGIDCALSAGSPSGSCTARFAQGTRVTLQPSPAGTSVFVAFSGDCALTACETTMDAPRIVTATFVPNTLSVLANAASSGAGRITSTPAGIDCQLTGAAPGVGACSASFAGGTVVTLEQEPAAGALFQGWGSSCTGMPCTVTMTGQRTVDATWRVATLPGPPAPPAPPASVTLRVAPSPASRGSGTVTSAPAGISCTVNDVATTGTCTMSVAAGTTVTLTQTAAGSAILQGWSGDCVGNPCQLTMAQPRVGEITYRLPAAGAVTVHGTGTGTGMVTSSPSGISCTSTAGVTSGSCSADFAAGTPVMLIAGGSGGASFDGFTGTCAGTSCTIPVVSSVNAVATASFTAAPQRLTIAAGSGSAGGGTVTSSPAGITCTLSDAFTSGTCTALFEANTVVTLLQSSSGVSVFSTWTGDCKTTPCQVTMSQPRAVQAVFQTQGLTVLGGGPGSGSITSAPSGIACTITAGVPSGSCSRTFAPNTVVTLTAIPTGINSFTGYSGDCLGTTCSVTITTGATGRITAQFDAPPTLTVAAMAGSVGGGTLVSTPAGIGCTLSGVSTSGACSAAYVQNTSVTVTQTSIPGSVFVTWGGACSGTGSCIVPLSSSRTVQAQYRLAVPGAITVNSGAGTGNGSVSSSPGGLACTITATVKGGICRAIFPVGSTVTVIPVANAGSTFTGFSGACTGLATCKLVVPENGELIVTANFTP